MSDLISWMARGVAISGYFRDNLDVLRHAEIHRVQVSLKDTAINRLHKLVEDNDSVIANYGEKLDCAWQENRMLEREKESAEDAKKKTEDVRMKLVKEKDESISAMNQTLKQKGDFRQEKDRAIETFLKALSDTDLKLEEDKKKFQECMVQSLEDIEAPFRNAIKQALVLNPGMTAGVFP